MTISIAWLRRNLRTTDNRVLAYAMQHSDIVIPVYVWDTYRPLNRCPNRLSFIVESVEALRQDLEELGLPLVMRRGHVHEEIARLANEVNATTVIADRNYEPYEIERDRKTAQALSNVGATLTLVKENVLFESAEVRTKEGKPYTVFTPFKKAVWERVTYEAEEVIGPKRGTYKSYRSTQSYESHTPPDLGMLDQSKFSSNRIQHGGSVAAHTRWEAFKNAGLTRYKQRRDLLADDFGTSQLSPHIKFGTISIRKLAREALELAEQPDFNEGATTFISELLWREFYYTILASFPHVEGSSFQPIYDGLRWEQNEAHLEAWKLGRTGVPVVDAAMRQLLETGWMHNRARMIVASFLTKDLLINWQEGELHFMWWLTDGDQAQNNGGWQWSASTGTDAQPYYRIFNPYLQSKKFDPEGEYIKRYVPELRSLPSKYIHEPHLMTPLEQSQYGCMLGEDYPLPIVDHSVQREKARAMFEHVRTRT